MQKQLLQDVGKLTFHGIWKTSLNLSPKLDFIHFLATLKLTLKPL
ncbi:hypothetical protein [Nostoc sp.]